MTTRIQHATGNPGGTATTVSATLAATPVAGRLMVAQASHRSAETATPSISGTGWTLRLAHLDGIASTSWRRAIFVWTKVAGASEPTTVTVTWATTVHPQLIAAEYSVEDATFHDIRNTATGEATGSPATPTTTALASGKDYLQISGFVARVNHPGDGSFSGIGFARAGSPVSELLETGGVCMFGSGFREVAGAGTGTDDTAQWTGSDLPTSSFTMLFELAGDPDPDPPPPSGCHRPVTVVELHQKTCSLTYGTAPCTAAIGTTGARKCFNTRATCQDLDNFDETTATLRFAEPVEGLPLAWNAIPSVQKVSIKSAKINIAGLTAGVSPLGVRGAATVTLQEHEGGESIADPYLADRPWQPRGTFWGRWLARHRDWSDLGVDILTGDLGQDLGDMKRRSYFLEEVAGPSGGGRVQLLLRDVLSRVDGRKSQAPRESEGTLDGAITDVSTSLVLTLPGAVADLSQYHQMGTADTDGLLRIGDEIIRYDGRSDNSPTAGKVQFFTLTRGAYNTEATAHDAGDGAQWGYEWIDKKPWEVIRDLLVNFAGVPPSWIDEDEWAAEHDRWLLPYNEISGFVVDPEATEDVIGTIAEAVMVYIWTDVEAQRIRMRAVRPVDEDIIDLTDETGILAGSLDRRVEMAEQVSRAAVYFGLIDAGEDLGDPRNYRNVRVVVGEQFGQPRVRRIAALWLKTDAQALQTGRTLVLASGVLPVYITAEVGAPMVDQVKPGSVVRLDTRILQDETGDRAPALFLVVEAQETPARRLKLTMRSIGGFPSVWAWADGAAESWPDGQDDGHGYWTDDEGLISGANPRRYWN